MKIYFAFTIRGDRSRLAIARQMSQLLKENGHTVMTDHFLSENVRNDDGNLDAKHVFERDMKWLKECDAVVAEASVQGFGIGYEVAHALNIGKKVFIFYSRDADLNVSLLAKGNTHPNCKVFEYSDLEDLKEKMKSI